MNQYKTNMQIQTQERYSMTSTDSTTSRTSYSHPLYRSSTHDSLLEDYNEDYGMRMISRFSSSSTSSNSSRESLASVPSHAEHSTNPSSICSRSPSTSKSCDFRTFTHATHRYADDHYPLITTCGNTTASLPVAEILNAVASAYNTLIRAINSAYNHANSITESQLADYLMYNQTLFNIISQHTRAQQQYILPLLGPITPASYYRRSQSHDEQDAANAAALDAWAEYIHDPSTLTSYSGSGMRLLLSSFAPSFVQSLHTQVSVMATKLSSREVYYVQLQKTWEKYQEILIQNLDVYTDIALLLGCHDKHFVIDGQTVSEEWPQLRTGQNTMVKKWHSRRQRDAWEFCPSDFSGRRRTVVSA